MALLEDNRSASANGSKCHSESKRSRTKSNISTTRTFKASFENNSSLFCEGRPRSFGHIASHPGSSNSTDDPDVLPRTGYNDENTLAGHPSGGITHSAHKLRYDLLGLAPPTTHEYLPDDEIVPSDPSLQRAHDEKIAACTVHGALLTEFHIERDIVSEVACEPQGMLTPLPIDRYLAEGPRERYALLNINQPGMGGEWARYSACLCEK